MSSLTLGFPGIGDTGSGNAAYISGLVMMDVMVSFCKGISVRCRRWVRLFYLLSLLLGDSRRADWRVTMLVPFCSLFLSLVYFLSLCDARIGGSVCCRHQVRLFSLSSLLTLCTSYWSDCCVTTLVPTGSILLFMTFLYLQDELLGVLTPLCHHFYLVCFYRLVNSCREACCKDAVANRQFSPLS